MEHMDRLYESPFAIPREDVQALLGSDGFVLLRSCLAGDADFCDFHAASDSQTRETWLLHRDLLHALVMPVVELQRRAEALASTALRTAKSEDLELAFAGEARGAFVWLQCFATGEEADWCRTRGCPACITTLTLSTESHIRLTIAASLVSTSSLASPPSSPAASASSSRASSPATEDPPQHPQDTTSAPALPPIPHILPALRAALAQDPFWGPTYWPYLLSRATQLSGGIQALIADCVDLEALVAAPASPTGPAKAVGPEERGLRLRKSKLAQRQLRMKGEETAYMRRCALQTWARAKLPSALRGKLLGLEDGVRGRRLSCP
ncbi:hypothetical protein DPSP01_011748 [Paraphaeosphaeria sporulosa]|uniref:Uncharacterized protein n=1 Tax=Paraphaeosphaeria sporulosa TaxID=1460663 RepID=A0A177CW24_9PLEO|nr:uncharacterized protein CC84DRAFT_1211402 [Paraphaeosphaeria sporulosa]OAG11764.1 hypothetical protein CC84DRAFT_1211402 [Paraphaeosphaeria sporulosa]